MAQDSTVTAKIYDRAGKQIRRIELGHILAGNYVESGKWHQKNGDPEMIGQEADGELPSVGFHR